jgi:transcriptional regulator with XRE-family HTH domain
MWEPYRVTEQRQRRELGKLSMRYFGAFLSNLRSNADLSLEELARLVETSCSTLSRIENNDVPHPFKGPIRKLLICIAELLCTSRVETERYLNLAGIDRSLLTETEEIQRRRVCSGREHSRECEGAFAQCGVPDLLHRRDHAHQTQPYRRRDQRSCA